MKRILHIVLLCISSIAFSQEEKAVVDIQISLGRQSLDCRGRGTCVFAKAESKEQANTQITNNKNSTITLIIDRSKITKEEEYKIVGQYLTTTSKVNELTFAMEDDFNLETETKTSLRTASHLTKIAKGNYPIIITKDTFTITLKLE